MCHSWVSYQDWDLKELCDEEIESGRDLRDSMTIDELKASALESNYDGFSIFTTDSGKAWHNDVFYKKCTGVQDSHLLTHALTKKQGVKLYLRVTHPCTGQIDFETFA